MVAFVMLRKAGMRILLCLIIISVVVGFSALIFRIYKQSMIDEVLETHVSVDTLVVLGASQWNNQPSPVFKSRLDHAVDLYKDSYAPNIILTGGVGEGEVSSESSVGREYLISKGINKDVIYIEEQGRTSWQSLNQVARILKKQNLRSVILVSDGFHMMRLKKMAADLNIESYASPVKTGPVTKNKFEEFKYILRETLVYVAYLLFKI